jgi:predicted dehydrogenase
MINVGIIGLGFMGHMHLTCYRNNPNAQVVAVADTDVNRLRGQATAGNLAVDDAEKIDLSGVQSYTDYHDLLSDPQVQLVSICLPTHLHAEATIQALQAGKDVLCEKPMARSLEECDRMERAARESGRQLIIGHVLQFMPVYEKASQMIASGDYGRVIYANFHRSTGSPTWGSDNWFFQPQLSGGAVLDTHIHDVDTVLWWLGAPSQFRAEGILWDGVPASVDAIWRYDDGPVVHLHSIWDNNGGPFRAAFRVVMEQGTLLWDLATGEDMLLLKEGETQNIAVESSLPHQRMIDTFLSHLQEGTPMERATPKSSRSAVEICLAELSQIQERSGESQSAI